MKLSREDILKLARLSRLRLSEEEIAIYQKELSAILDYVAQLDTVDVEGLKPTYQVTGLTSQDKNATRTDEVTAQVVQEELFKNLPALEGDHIKVKRMIG
ncbi:MAG: Asp-tRNA(Asn)/Glu-tRNA(Gln) amidotransferase subunit GatC [Candidatus Saccharimonadales bacterium]